MCVRVLALANAVQCSCCFVQPGVCAFHRGTATSSDDLLSRLLSFRHGLAVRKYFQCNPNSDMFIIDLAKFLEYLAALSLILVI